MISLKFPGLHNALTKNQKDLDENDPRKGVIILNEHAIVIQDSFCVVCNLKDYFVLEEGIEDDEEIKELDKILFYMNEKVFTQSLWKEMIKYLDMEIRNGSLYVEHPKYAKDLHYKELNVDFLEPLSALTKLNNQAIMEVSAIALPFNALTSIFNIDKTGFKTDNIIFEFTGMDMPVKFTFRKRKHIYGYLNPHYDAAQEGFKFEDLDGFVLSFKDMLDDIIKENKEKAIAAAATPPPPPVDKKPAESSEDDNGQMSIV